MEVICIKWLQYCLVCSKHHHQCLHCYFNYLFIALNLPKGLFPQNASFLEDSNICMMSNTIIVNIYPYYLIYFSQEAGTQRDEVILPNDTELGSDLAGNQTQVVYLGDYCTGFLRCTEFLRRSSSENNFQW